MTFYARVKDRWSGMTRPKLARGSGLDKKTVNLTIRLANKGSWVSQALFVMMAMAASPHGLQTDLEDFAA